MLCYLAIFWSYFTLTWTNISTVFTKIVRSPHFIPSPCFIPSPQSVVLSQGFILTVCSGIHSRLFWLFTLYNSLTHTSKSEDKKASKRYRLENFDWPPVIIKDTVFTV